MTCKDCLSCGVCKVVDAVGSNLDNAEVVCGYFKNRDSAQTIKWISVKDKLPPDDEIVPVIVSGKFRNCTFEDAIELGEYCSEEKNWCLEHYPEWSKPNVTHWMPLPEWPKKGKSDSHDS